MFAKNLEIALAYLCEKGDFYQRLAQEMLSAKAFATPPAGDGSEYDAEEAQQQRYKKLGVRRGSRFLNIGVDNQVTWPAEETPMRFDKHKSVYGRGRLSSELLGPSAGNRRRRSRDSVSSALVSDPRSPR
jgi:hypothetical protein